MISVLSIVTLVLILNPGDTYITASKYSTGYFAISVGTTVFLTLAIVVRLLLMRRRIGRVMGHNIAEYLSVSAMLVESAFVYSAVALPHAVLNALNNPAQLLTFHVLGQVQVQVSLPRHDDFRIIHGCLGIRYTVNRPPAYNLPRRGEACMEPRDCGRG